MSEEQRDEVVEYVAPARVRRTSNPRRQRDPIAFAELTASIRESGQLSPCICREIGDEDAVELVIGEGRVLACEQLGIDVAVIVRSMTPAEAHAARVAENERREPLSILDRAEAARVAIEEHGYTAESWAIRMGAPSARAVRRDLQILDLVPFWKRALEAGLVDEAAALAIAQAPADVQSVITKEPGFSHAIKGKVRITKADVADVLAAHTLDLKNAPFNTGDATLVPEAGACGDCPHRSEDRQGALLSEVVGSSTCLRPPCHSLKVDADVVLKLAASRKAGLLVLDEKRAAKALELESEYVDLDGIAYYRTPKGKPSRADGAWTNGQYDDHTPVMWREVLADAAPVIAVDARSKRIVHLALRTSAMAALARILPPDTTSVSEHDRAKPDKAAAKAKRAAEKAKTAGLDAAVIAFRDAFVPEGGNAHDTDLLRFLVSVQIRTYQREVLTDFCRIVGVSFEDASTGAKVDAKEAAARHLATIKGRDVGWMHIALVMLSDRHAYENGVSGTAFEGVAEIVGVKLAHHIRAAERAAKGVVEPKKRRGKKSAQTEFAADAAEE